ncbi:serine/threonine-protein kinase fray2 isoform X2 [Drosophila biarmipes]|uniref:serine/threonine-protein kinase fray2 isoform X2 n=1 Tax=Drosophila biarmipes TaxID=125945 RepID=UPI0007E6013F|nr:serine/threonine-protein kinase fray2 isoform X2 [Drosophila biarmipes]
MNRVLYPSRRQAADVFHGDPFKIQSYNFRYADKPFYPAQNYQRPTAPPLVRKPSFQTFYYNPRFSHDPEYIPASRRPPTSSFVEHRRRQLLRDSRAMPSQPWVTPPGRPSVPVPVPVPPQTRRSPTVTDFPLLRTCCLSGECQSMRRGGSTMTLSKSSLGALRSTTGGVRLPSTTTFSSGSNSQLQTKRSGCGISINICSVDPQSEVDNNVSIKIEADAYLLNNTDEVKHKTQQEWSSPTSSGTFGIDKRLSKFNVSETRPRTSPEWEPRQRERARVLERQQERERDRQLLEDRRLERERELQEDRDRARQRERDREHLRTLERLRDEERLLELEVEREKQRLRELERETQRHRECNRFCVIQEESSNQRLEHLQRKPDNPQPPVPMTSHLYAVTSDDRLPGMAFCDLSSRRPQRLHTSMRDLPRSKKKRRARAVQDARTVRSANLSLTPPPIFTRNSSSRSPIPSRAPTSRSSSHNRSADPSSTRSPTPNRAYQESTTPSTPRILDRCSSGTSNGNVHVTVTTSGGRSNCSMRRSSNQRVSEPKVLNGSHPFVTTLNHMPIRITTSRTADRDLAFSLNHVRIRGSSPVPREGRSSAGGQDACQVNINVYSQKLRLMRI